MGRSQEQRRLVRCMNLELRNHVPQQYGKVYCPFLWEPIFKRFWDEVPEDKDDPRWNIILHELKGLVLLTRLTSGA